MDHNAVPTISEGPDIVIIPRHFTRAPGWRGYVASTSALPHFSQALDEAFVRVVPPCCRLCSQSTLS